MDAYTRTRSLTQASAVNGGSVVSPRPQRAPLPQRVRGTSATTSADVTLAPHASSAWSHAAGSHSNCHSRRSPTASMAASAAAVTTPAASSMKHILKRVESHVRLMSHLENVSVSSSYTALRLRVPADRAHATQPLQQGSAAAAAVASPMSQPLTSAWPPSSSTMTAHGTATRVADAASQQQQQQHSHRIVDGVDGHVYAHDAASMPTATPPRAAPPMLPASPSLLTLSPSPPSSSSSSSWSPVYGATRVHRGSSTLTFYEDVVAPCVANSLAGQSYLFLVSGPMESGRSQTLYGSPHHSERGLIELTAVDLLQRVRSYAVTAATDGEVNKGKDESDNENTTTTTTAAPTPSSSSGLLVTYSAFTTRGSTLTDTLTGQPVRVVDYPPPMGAVVLPHMRVLEHAAEAVAIPSRKYADTSCVIQFHVYAPVGGAGGGNNNSNNNNYSNSNNASAAASALATMRRSMATLTFVDLAAFRLPLCRELLHVVETVRRVAGVSTRAATPTTSTSAAAAATATLSAASVSTPSRAAPTLRTSAVAAAVDGADDDGTTRPHGAPATQLTRLLEPALVGYVTLVSITTISGRPDLHEAACAALAFATDVSRIHQVLMLTHLATPRWVYETALRVEALRARYDARVATAYARGVWDCYGVVQRWLRSGHTAAAVDVRLRHLCEATAAARAPLLRATTARVRDAATQLRAAHAARAAAVAVAEEACAAATARVGEVQRLDEAVAACETQRAHAEMQCSRRISALRFDVAARDARSEHRRRECEQLQRECGMHQQRLAAVTAAVARYREDLHLSQQLYTTATALSCIGAKRARLEAELQRASDVAQCVTHTLRRDRERRSQLSHTTLTSRTTTATTAATTAATPATAEQRAWSLRNTRASDRQHGSSAVTSCAGGCGGDEGAKHVHGLRTCSSSQEQQQQPSHLQQGRHEQRHEVTDTTAAQHRRRRNVGADDAHDKENDTSTLAVSRLPMHLPPTTPSCSAAPLLSRQQQSACAPAGTSSGTRASPVIDVRESV